MYESVPWRNSDGVEEVGHRSATVKVGYDFRQSPSLYLIPKEALECTLCLRVCLLSGQACWVSVFLYQLIICLGPPQEGQKFPAKSRQKCSRILKTVLRRELSTDVSYWKLKYMEIKRSEGSKGFLMEQSLHLVNSICRLSGFSHVSNSLQSYRL